MSVADSNTVIFDDYEAIEAAAVAKRARLQRSRMEVQSYFALDGQSAREDYHRATAALNGLVDVVPGWSNGYTTFEKVAFALNHLENLTAGQTETRRRPVVVESKTFPVGLWMLCPERAVLAVANVVGFLAGAPAVVRPWRWERAEAGQHVLSTFSGKTRPAKPGERCVRILVETQVERVVEERWVEEQVEAAPVWANPHQVEDGFTFLVGTPHYNLRQPGAEGLTLLIDRDGRYHLVLWATARFPHRRLGQYGKPYLATNRVGKKPLAVRSFALPTDEADALIEMSRVREALAGVDPYIDDPVQGTRLLPWMAAEMAAAEPPSTSAPMITGSHEWLTAVADQRMTGETYRPRGATSDD